MSTASHQPMHRTSILPIIILTSSSSLGVRIWSSKIANWKDRILREILWSTKSSSNDLALNLNLSSKLKAFKNYKKRSICSKSIDRNSQNLQNHHQAQLLIVSITSSRQVNHKKHLLLLFSNRRLKSRLQNQASKSQLQKLIVWKRKLQKILAVLICQICLRLRLFSPLQAARRMGIWEVFQISRSMMSRCVR